MPADRQTVSGRLGNVVGGEERNVRPDQGLGDIEQSFVAEKTYPERIAGYEAMPQPLRAKLGMALDQPVDMPVDFGDQAVFEHTADDDRAVAVKRLLHPARILEPELADHEFTSTPFCFQATTAGNGPSPVALPGRPAAGFSACTTWTYNRYANSFA